MYDFSPHVTGRISGFIPLLNVIAIASIASRVLPFAGATDVTVNSSMIGSP